MYIERIFGPHGLSAVLAIVLKHVGKVYSLDVVEDVVLLGVLLAAEGAGVFEEVGGVLADLLDVLQ